MKTFFNFFVNLFQKMKQKPAATTSDTIQDDEIQDDIVWDDRLSDADYNKIIKRIDAPNNPDGDYDDEGNLVVEYQDVHEHEGHGLSDRKKSALLMYNAVGNFWQHTSTKDDDFVYIGTLPTINYNYNAYHSEPRFMNTLFKLGMDYMIPIFLECKWLKHSTEPNRIQSDWFRRFVKNAKSYFVINPADKEQNYELYFADEVPAGKVIYSDIIPVGYVLCFRRASNQLMHLQDNIDGTTDIWVSPLNLETNHHPKESEYYSYSQKHYVAGRRQPVEAMFRAEVFNDDMRDSCMLVRMKDFDTTTSLLDHLLEN